MAGLRSGILRILLWGKCRRQAGARSPIRLFTGSSNRYYRANQVGTFVQDNIRLRPNLTVNWDCVGIGTGRCTRRTDCLRIFMPRITLTIWHRTLYRILVWWLRGIIKSSGLKGVSDSTMTARQWGFGPRIGVVWSHFRFKNVVVRAGVGLYYDRGEYFTRIFAKRG